MFTFIQQALTVAWGFRHSEIQFPRSPFMSLPDVFHASGPFGASFQNIGAIYDYY